MLTWHELVLCHPRDAAPTAESVQALLEASGHFSPDTRFETSFEDEAERPFDSSLAFIREHLARPGVQLMTLRARKKGESSDVSLWYRRDFGAFHGVFFINPESSVLTPRTLPQYTAMLASASRAPVSTLYTRELASLSHFGTWADLDEAATDDGLLAAETTPRVARAVPRELALRLTTRIRITDYDRGRIPESVGWMNAWSAGVVDRIGRDEIFAQPWETIAPLDEDGLLLVACTDPPDAKRIDLLERIAQISERLGLESLRRHG